jgi:hypothetical protein
MTRDWMAIEEAREAGRQPDYEEVDTDDCKCSRCETRRQRADEIKRIAALEARVAELENRLAAGFPQGVTVTATSSTIRISTCPKCLVTTQHNETGNILTSMPPQTEMQCRVCKHRWGIL